MRARRVGRRPRGVYGLRPSIVMSAPAQLPAARSLLSCPASCGASPPDVLNATDMTTGCPGPPGCLRSVPGRGVAEVQHAGLEGLRGQQLEGVLGSSGGKSRARPSPTTIGCTSRAPARQAAALQFGDQRAVWAVVRASSRAMSSRARGPGLASTLSHSWSSDRAGLTASARASRDMPAPMSWPGCSTSPSV